MRHGARLNFTGNLDALERVVTARRDQIEWETRNHPNCIADIAAANGQDAWTEWVTMPGPVREHLNDRYELAAVRPKGRHQGT